MSPIGFSQFVVKLTIGSFHIFWDNKSGTVFFPCRFYPEELHKRGVCIRRV